MKLKQKDAFFDDKENESLNFDTQEKDVHLYLKIAAFSFSSFCFSCLKSLGSISPFTVAFLGSIDFDMCFPCFVFGCLGYFLSRQWQYALKYTVACALMCLLRLVVNKRLSHLDKGKISYVGAFFCTFIPGLIFMCFMGFSYTGLFMLFCESGLSLCATVFFIRSLKTPVFRTGIMTLGIKDKTSIVVSLGIFLMCMSGFDIEGLSPARICAHIFIMCLAFYKGGGTGAVCGVIAGSALCIDESFRFLFPCFAVAGLVSGVFSSFGQIPTAISFGSVYCAACLLSNTSSGVLLCIIEAVIASGAFMLIPSRAVTAFQDFLLKKGVIADTQIANRVSAQLYAAANNVNEVSKVVAGVSEKLDGIINPEVNRLFAQLQQRVCSGCESKSKCWNKMFDSTASDILSLAGIESTTQGRRPIEKRCPRRDKLIDEIKAELPEYTNSIAVKMKLSEMRKVLTDQFCLVSDFLNQTAQAVQDSRTVDTARSLAMRTALQDAGIYTDALSFFQRKDGRVTVEISIIDRPFDTDSKKLKNIIEFLSKRRFFDGIITVGDVKTTIAFEEKSTYEVSFGYSQRPMKKGNLCGDSVSLISCPDGGKAALISDGMGTGARAAIDSTMTASIAEKLISSGFSVNGTVKTVNSAMIMKSTDESIASVDCVKINTFTGEAEFYKSGAAISFIRHDKEIFVVEAKSLPVGIIRNIAPVRQTAKLEAGDIVLLVSDGVTATDCAWINDELLSWSTDSMDDLAGHITSLAHLRSDKYSRDDITAVAVKLKRAK